MQIIAEVKEWQSDDYIIILTFLILMSWQFCYSPVESGSCDNILLTMSFPSDWMLNTWKHSKHLFSCKRKENHFISHESRMCGYLLRSPRTHTELQSSNTSQCRSGHISSDLPKLQSLFAEIHSRVMMLIKTLIQS